MKSDWILVAEKVRSASCAEDIFGKLEGKSQTEQQKISKKLYRRFACLLHPDVHATESPADQTTAEEAFKLLDRWWDVASEAIAKGNYGNRAGETKKIELIPINGKDYQYNVGPEFAAGDKSIIWWAHSRGKETSEKGFLALLKVAGDSCDNDLLSQEAQAIQYLRAQAGNEFDHYIPEILESFTIKQDGMAKVQQVNAFRFRSGFYPLTEVRKAYPDGIDPRAAAWMLNRLLAALGFAHHTRIVHGAVLPAHVLIDPENHDLMLVDWSYSVRDSNETGQHIPAITSPEYAAWYPQEVMRKLPANPATDIMMAAECLYYLLGGDPLAQIMPKSVPKKMEAFAKTCLFANPSWRPQDAWDLQEEFKELLRELFGPPKFYILRMSAQKEPPIKIG